MAKENKVSLVSEGFLFDSVASTKEEIVEVLANSSKITKDKILSMSQQHDESNPVVTPKERITIKETPDIPKTTDFDKPIKFYCNVCKETISERVYTYSTIHYGKPLCIPHQKQIAPENCSCRVCKKPISEQVSSFSMSRIGAPLCITHQKTVTPQAIRLSNALAI